MLGVIIMVLTGLVLMVLGCLIWKKRKNINIAQLSLRQSKR